LAIATPAAEDPRALIVSAYAEPHLGGVEVIVAQQARTLAALGHRVTVIASRCDAEAAKHELVDGFEVVRVPAWNGLEESQGVPLPIWGPSAIWRLTRLIGKADVVHVHDVYRASSIVAACLARWLGRPLFVTQHVAIVDHDKAVVKLVQKLVYSSFARLAWRWASTITVYNPVVQGFVAGYGVATNKIRLAHNGIDTADFRPGDPNSSRATRIKYGLDPDLPVILFVGRLVPKKGFDKLIAARGPEYQLVLAGPGKVPDNVPEGVRFLGPVSRRDLRDLYQASDIFALPAVGEMLTLAMQEAMACGLPVVATHNLAYATYELDPAGVALISPEAAQLRATFLDILSDPERQARMRSYSRKVAEDLFDWQKNVGQLAAEHYAPCPELEPANVHGSKEFGALPFLAEEMFD
jgi:D-inositol-3-phosphate glycosyltransferase